jgi:hypothetical protein
MKPGNHHVFPLIASERAADSVPFLTGAATLTTTFSNES